jgi:ADP-ribose pyrophosphatase
VSEPLNEKEVLRECGPGQRGEDDGGILRVLEDALFERTVESRLVYEGSYLTFRIETVEDADRARHKREIVVHPGAVAVVALAGYDVLLVRQFRTPAARVLLEIPAGKLDRDESGNPEEARRAAERELQEETGYEAGRWRRLGSFFTAPGFTTEELTLFLAQDLSLIDERPGPDEGEHIELVQMPWRDAVAMADRGEIADAKTLIGLFWLARLDEEGEL